MARPPAAVLGPWWTTAGLVVAVASLGVAGLVAGASAAEAANTADLPATQPGGLPDDPGRQLPGTGLPR